MDPKAVQAAKLEAARSAVQAQNESVEEQQLKQRLERGVQAGIIQPTLVDNALVQIGWKDPADVDAALDEQLQAYYDAYSASLSSENGDVAEMKQADVIAAPDALIPAEIPVEPIAQVVVTKPTLGEPPGSQYTPEYNPKTKTWGWTKRSRSY
jgi:hypothetical protein